LITSEILTEAKRLGVILVADAGKIKARPAGVISSDLVRMIREHKDELLQELGSPVEYPSLTKEEVEALPPRPDWERGEVVMIVDHDKLFETGERFGCCACGAPADIIMPPEAAVEGRRRFCADCMPRRTK
jgi:hypothetical protein